MRDPSRTSLKTIINSAILFYYCGEAQFLGRRTSSWSLDYNSKEDEPKTAVYLNKNYRILSLLRLCLIKFKHLRIDNAK